MKKVFKYLNDLKDEKSKKTTTMASEDKDKDPIANDYDDYDDEYAYGGGGGGGGGGYYDEEY